MVKQRMGASASQIVAASIVAAGSAFCIQWLVGRAVEPHVYAEFLVFWSLLFGVYGVVTGTQNETTRAVGAQQLSGEERGTRVMPAAFLLGGIVGVVVVGSSPLWASTLVGSTLPWAVLMVGIGVVLYAAQASLSGALAGTERWGLYSIVMAGEALVRFLLVMAVLAWWQGLMQLEIAVTLAGAAWLVLVACSFSARQAAASRADVGLRRLMRNFLWVMASSGASALILTGFPAVMKLTSRGVPPEVLGSTIFAIMITRSPIMIPLQAFQGVAITRFLRAGDRAMRPLLGALGLLSGLGLVAALPGYVVGPWLIRVLFSGKYEVSGWLIAGLLIAAGFMAMLTLSGTAVIALNAHRGYVAGWFLAAIIAIVLLFLPTSLGVRTVTALIVGPGVGVLTHVLATAGALRAKANSDA